MDTKLTPFASLSELAEWCRRAPAGTHLDASVLADVLDTVEVGPPLVSAGEDTPTEWTWRERLWDVPSETRLGVAELAEALGKPKSYVYARTGVKAEDPLPHRKMDNSLVFTAGEVRAWIREREEVVHAGPLEPPRLRAV